MTSPILGELLQRTTALRALARELVGDAHADDIVQETAIQSMTTSPKRSGAAGGWLAAVVRNLARKHRRAEGIRHRHEAKAARAEVAPPDRSAEDADILRRLTEIVTSLPEPYRGTILARYLREQTPSEIAAATGTPIRTVKTRLQRGLALLRDRLDERSEDWRAMLVGAFALDSTVASSAPTLNGTTMKLALSAAVFLTFGFVIWNQASDSPPTGSALALGRSPATDAGASREAGIPGPVADAGDPIDRGATPAGLAPDLDLLASVNPPQQEGSALPAERPLMTLDVVGPAAFRAAFRNTNIGGLFASEQGEELWRPLLAPAEVIWRLWDGRDEDFKATRQRVLEYAGRIRVLWMVQAGEGRELDRVFGVFALETDGSTDLSALAGDLSRVMTGFLPDDVSERRVGEHDLRLIGNGDGGMVTMPMVIGGSLVAFFGEAASLEQTVPRSLRALATNVEQPFAPVSLHIDLSQLKELWALRTEPPLVKAFGLETLRSLHATVSPNGLHAQLQIDVEFGDGDRGGMAAFLPAVDTLSSLLARVPVQATPWLTVPLRPDLLFRAGLVAEAEYHALGSDEVSGNFRQDLYDELGLYIDTELLDHLSGDVLVLGDLWQPDDPDLFRDGGDPPLGACVAFSLKDTAAFGRGFDKLLDHLRGIVHRYETREVDGVKITRLGSMFLTGLHMAVGQDLFALGFGKEGVAQLEALVVGGQAAAARPLPAAVERVRHLAPAGWNGLGLANLNAMFGGQVTLALEALDNVLPSQMRFDYSFTATQGWFDRMLPLVEQYELENLVTMTGYENGRWRLRLLW